MIWRYGDVAANGAVKNREILRCVEYSDDDEGDMVPKK